MFETESSALEEDHAPVPSKRLDLGDLTSGLVLLVILALAAGLRFVGLNWDEYTHLHPDERFLTLVESNIQPPESLAEYFDTENSPLNPHNKDAGFFVYGTLPIFLVRYVAEWVGQTGYDEIHLVGRAVSSTFDLISIVLVYLIGARLYRRRVGLLAAALSAVSVLLIQHAHFFVVDPIANTFILAGFYFAVRIKDEGRLQDYLLFGAALGMAVASKINAAPLAGVAALAGLTRWLQAPLTQRNQVAFKVLANLSAAAFLSLVVFRIFQPYAFSGPTIFGVIPNDRWLNNMAEIREMNRGNTDAPYALQWANRAPILFSLSNLVLWGLGAPLGIVAWLGWGWAAIQVFRGRWNRHLLLVVWTGAYFLWQSTGFTPAMRYQLPVYPTLTLLAAWAIWEAWDWARGILSSRWRVLASYGVGAVGLFTLLGTTVWAFAFSSIYTQPLTRVSASRWIYTHIPGVMNLVVDVGDEQLLEVLPMPTDFTLLPDGSHTLRIETDLRGEIISVSFPYVRAVSSGGGPASFKVEIVRDPSDTVVLAKAVFEGTLASNEEIALDIPLDRPLHFTSEEEVYFLRLEHQSGESVGMRGSILVHETTWDDGLPWGVDGRGIGGRYDVRNLELYWGDDQDEDASGTSDKLERIVEYLAEGEYLTISSNRQYGTIPRVPIRYPLTTAYYRALFGCDAPLEISQCAAHAEVGEIEEGLGYTLIQVFQSNPTLGPLEINDQGAEEAFTVYDHPKVMLFKKDEDFSESKVREILSRVVLTGVVHVLPRDVGNSPRPPRDLLLDDEVWAAQQEGGTWSDLFNRDSLINRSNFLAIIVWWIVIGGIGILAFPLTRAVFRGFKDGGYPIARLVGLLVVAWGAWILGSIGVPVSALTILFVLVLLALLSLGLAWRDRESLKVYVQEHKREILWTEIFALGFFLFDLLIRFGNPDLWHPGYGGEKPMDFSYLNAVLKSSTFPPYDPWFAGGYINYYYYGFVIVGMPIKLIGLIPSIAYNLVLPTLFALLALAGYSVGYNLVQSTGALNRRLNPRLAGTAAALALVVLGNLGTAKMFYEGFKKLGTEPGDESSTALVGLAQTVRGVGRFLTLDGSLDYPLHQWYWNPSRSITPGEGEPGPITEFPFFTFLYADLHAHMISRPLTVLAVGWSLSWVLASRKKVKHRWLDFGLGLLIGGMILGSLRPTNTWDFPVYWVLGALAVLYGARSVDRPQVPVEEIRESIWWNFTAGIRRLDSILWRLKERLGGWYEAIAGIITATLLLVLAQFMYQPYHQAYGLGYVAADLWEGSRTSLADFLTVHGLFLFILVSWMVWESINWMAETPLSALSRLKPARGLIILAVLVMVFAVFYVAGVGYAIGLLAVPLMLWVGILLLRRDQAAGKQFVLVLVGVGLALTFVVEVVVLRGDIGRMNTVFKFYLQVWELFSLASGAALAWLISEVPYWRRGLRRVWLGATAAFVFMTALYPLTAAPAKVKDRMDSEAPKTLDGMQFMAFADNYYNLGYQVSLDEDYEAIRWMQDNVEGSPVIVEANVPEYRWGSRFTIYTGLPGVLGWRWHQSQQRVASPDSGVDQRLFDITDFYLTDSLEEAEEFLQSYGVRYVIVGGLERIYYAEVRPCYPAEQGVTCNLSGWPMGMPTVYEIPPGSCEQVDPDQGDQGLICPTHALEKFDQMVDEGLIEIAFQIGDTTIYEVID